MAIQRRHGEEMAALTRLATEQAMSSMTMSNCEEPLARTDA